MKISVIFVGELHDNGFNQCALEGVKQFQRTEGAGVVDVVSGIPYDPAAMDAALRNAAGLSDGVVFIGGQGNRVTPDVADAFPDRAFAIVQGNVTCSNIASYDVLQEQSAFLAGVFAIITAGIVCQIGGYGFDVPPRDILIALSMGVFQVGLGLTIFTIGSKVVPAAELALLSMTEVLLGPIWVWLLLGETASFSTLLGGLILMLAIAGNALSGLRRKPVPVI